MPYKVTRQFIKDVETPGAEFDDIDDASLYIAVKLRSYTKSMKLIYRLYQDDTLISEHHDENLRQPISRAKYAQGDNDLPDNFAEPFRVSCHSSNNVEKNIAKFIDITNAQLFIEALFSSGKPNNRVDVVYKIYNINQLVKIVDQRAIGGEAPNESQGKNKKITFRPTPFSVKLTMGPKNYLVEDNDEDNKNEK